MQSVSPKYSKNRGIYQFQPFKQSASSKSPTRRSRQNLQEQEKCSIKGLLFILFLCIGCLYIVHQHTKSSVNKIIEHVAIQTGEGGQQDSLSTEDDEVGDATQVDQSVEVKQQEIQQDIQTQVETAGLRGGEDPQPSDEQNLVVSGDASEPHDCQMMKHTDMWGDALMWGSINKKESAAECCKQCRELQPQGEDQVACNVWVFCEDQDLCGDSYKDCWLKHLAHPDGVKPSVNPNIGWTAGIVGDYGELDRERIEKQVGGKERKFHVITTAQGSPTHWQVRIHYYYYQKHRKTCIEQYGEDCHMGGFTRILHSGTPDDLMEEMNTFVAQPLPDEQNRGYLVLNRPYAILQWIQQVEIPEKYVLMSEPDHLFMKPMPNIMKDERAASFPFFYIEPSKAEHQPITEMFTGKLNRRQFDEIAPIGNAPTMMRHSDLKKMAPRWLNVSRDIFDNPESNKAWGWVLEMYGFTISCFLEDIKPIDLHLELMSQPPFETEMTLWDGREFFILHYTYGNDFDAEGNFTPGTIGHHRFDKRTWSVQPPPVDLEDPPENIHHPQYRMLIKLLKEAMADIPGWQDYHNGQPVVIKKYD